MANDNILPLTIDALLAGENVQLRQLLTRCYGNTSSGKTNPAQLVELFKSTRLLCDEALNTAIQQQLSPEDAPDSDSIALITFVDQLFNNYHKNNGFHPVIQQTLNRFRVPALLSLCRGRLPWQDEDSPLGYLSTLSAAVCGWQPEVGRAAEKVLHTLSPLIAQLANSTDRDSRQAIIDELDKFIDREQQRVVKLEQRLRDAEIGQLHARHAQQFSAKTLNQQMAGKKLPAHISAFLQGPWRESMRLILLSEGKDSEQWRKIVRLTETLIWTFQPLGDNAPPEKRQHIYDSISELAEQMQEVIVGLHHSGELDDELAQIEAEHLKILKGEPLQYQPFELIDNSDPLLSAQVSISNGLIKNVNKINEGQWFSYRADDGDKRIKLSIKIDSAQQLLFTNFTGIKVEQFNYEEFAYMMSSKIVSAFTQRDILKATGEKMLHSLLQHYQRQVVSVEKNVEEVVQQESDASRNLAKEKALQEAKSHAEASTHKTPEVETQEVAQPDDSSVPENVEAQLQHIVPGAIMAFKNTAGEEQSCRLAAILQATGEYIFVNKSGIKQYSLSRQQLTELLSGSKVRLIHHGSDIRGALEQVVDNFRSRKPL